MSLPDVASRARAEPPAPYVFVVGCPRSGTTLLQRMLDAHPELAVANDTHFISRAISKVTLGSISKACEPASKAALVEWTRNDRRFARLGLDAATVEQADRASETFPDFVTELYRALARRRGKRLAGEKTPDYIRHLALLHTVFPAARTVHIVRDGRDVTLSLLEWANETKGPGRLELWRREPVAACALWWRFQVGGQRQAAGLPPTSYLEIKYEDLVADPAATLEPVTTLLGLPFAPEMLRFNRGRVSRDPGLSAKKAWLGPTPGLRDWRTQLDSRSVALFEALAGDRLVQNGYSLAFDETPPSVAAVAEECRAWWEERRRRRARLRRLARRGKRTPSDADRPGEGHATTAEAHD